MSGVYLAGRGLASALGDDLPQALAALRRGGVAPQAFEVSPGNTTPYFGMPPTPEDWATRARRLVQAAAAESGALGGPGGLDARDGALLIASTSFDMGVRELGDPFERDIAYFSEEVGRWLDWRGPIFTVCTACTSALNALMSGAALVRAGDVDDALVLGFELSNRLTVGGFQAMQLLSPTGAQPLGAARNGLVLGEAVAALRLSARPARWRVCGGANVVDASDPAGAVAGAVAAMGRLALERSGLGADRIDLVKLQAAGSGPNDSAELAGLRQLFGAMPAVLSLKAFLGHTLGAAGAAEVALLTACVEANVWPVPSYALDPVLDFGLETARTPALNPAQEPPSPIRWAHAAPPRLRHVLATILGFGGGHAAVVLEDTAAA